MIKEYAFNIRGFQVSVNLTDEQQAKFAELTLLNHGLDSVLGFSTFEPDSVYFERLVLRAFERSCTLDEMLEAEFEYLPLRIEHEKELRQRWKSQDDSEAGDVPTRNPSPDEVTPEGLETVSNGEEEVPTARKEDGDAGDVPTRNPSPDDGFRDKGYLYDPSLYEGDAYECGSIVVTSPERLAFADAMFEAL